MIQRLFWIYSELGLKILFSFIYKYIYMNLMTYLLKHQSIRWIYYRERSQTDAEKTKIEYVDPDIITKQIKHPVRHKISEPGVVYAGCWDRAVESFNSNNKLRSFIRHFEQGVDWEDTWYWKTSSNKSKFKYYDYLFESIKNEGYMTQEELQCEQVEKYSNLNLDGVDTTGEYDDVDLNEIGIAIGRNGELIFLDGGQHRLCIAKILNLNKVPVQIRTRHKRWQEVRNDIRCTENQESLNFDIKKMYNHPDLNDVC